MSDLTITNRARSRRLDGRRLKPQVRRVAAAAGLTGPLSLVLVDDREMHDLNRRFLDHDYTTDVLAFPYDEDVDGLCGEVVVCVETADREAAARERSFQSEFLLYVTHGILHLTGMEDHTRAGRQKMQKDADEILAQLGV